MYVYMSSATMMTRWDANAPRISDLSRMESFTSAAAATPSCSGVRTCVCVCDRAVCVCALVCVIVRVIVYTHTKKKMTM